MDHHVRRRVRVWLNDHGSFGVLSMQPLNIGAHRTFVDITAGDNDAITVGYTNHDAFLVRINRFRLILIRLVYIQTNLL